MNQEFRTNLGARTDYGKPYTKQIVKDAVRDYLLQHGADGSMIFFRDEDGVLKKQLRLVLLREKYPH